MEIQINLFLIELDADMVFFCNWYGFPKGGDRSFA